MKATTESEYDWERDEAVDDWLFDKADESTNGKNVVCLLQPMKVKFSAQAEESIRDKPVEISESDKLLFNPCEDEQNQQWVMKTLLKYKQEDD